MSDEVSEARKKLVEALGDYEKCYFDLLRSWFRMQRTKEEFDAEARKLLSYVHIPLHNRFMLALFRRCQGLDSSPSCADHPRAKDPAQRSSKSGGASSSLDKDRKSRVKRRHSEKSAFEAANVADYCRSPGTPPGADGAAEGRRPPSLPDQALVCGRMLVAAWEHDLTGVADRAEEILTFAMEIILKNIVQAAMMRKTSYKMTPRGFVYDLGAIVPNPWLCNTTKLGREVYNRCGNDSEEDEDPDKISKTDVTLEDIEANAAYSIACGDPSRAATFTPISAWDLLEAMQVERQMFRANSVYTLNVERLLMLLEHPSHEEIEALSKC